MNVTTGDRAKGSSPALRKIRRVALSVAFGTAVLLAAASLLEKHEESNETERIERSDFFADVGGARVRYQLLGAEEPGPMVVFLNGMAASMEQWQKVVPEVTKFAPTLVYDRGGYGYSYGSAAHSASEQADELAALLVTLKITRPLILVGYSISASIARVFVARYRAQVAGVTLLEPYLPELEGRYFNHGPYRTYYRWLTYASVSSFFGFRRLKAFVRSRRGEVALLPPPLLRFSHWWAVDRELFATPETRIQALTADRMGEVPLILLAPRAWESEDSFLTLRGEYHDFANTSTSGSLRFLPDGVPHGEVVEDQRSCAVLIDAIREQALHVH